MTRDASMQARDLMTTRVVTVDPETPVREVAWRMIEKRISAVPVVDDDGRLCGIVSEGDLIRRPETRTERHPSWWLVAMTSPAERAREYVRSHGGKASDIMTTKVVTVSEDTEIDEIASLLERHRIKRVPVVRNGKVVGVVSRANLLHGLISASLPERVMDDDRDLRQVLLESFDEAGLDTTFLNVVVTGGRVQLWGMVSSQAELDAIRVACERAPGVTEVENNVSVASQRAQRLT